MKSNRDILVLRGRPVDEVLSACEDLDRQEPVEKLVSRRLGQPRDITRVQFYADLSSVRGLKLSDK